MAFWYLSNIWEAVWRCLTSNSPCFLTSTPFSRLQKYRWDLPHVTMTLQSVGWKSTPNTDSLEHWRQRKCCRYTCACRILLIFLFLTHFNFSQPVLSLPVPDRKDVVVGVIDGTQRVSSILKVKSSHIHTCSERKSHARLFLCCFLTDLEKARQTRARSKKPEPRTWRVLRLTESQTRTWGASCCHVEKENQTQSCKSKTSVNQKLQ